MKLLITGGSGLVGQGLKEVFLNIDIECIFLSSKDCNLISYTETYELFNKIKPDYVIHCAANVGGLFKNMNNKVQMFEDNMLMTMNVFKCCYQFDVKKVINLLSTCIFPDKVTYPINENDLHHGPPHFSNDAYAYAKRNGEILAQAYNNQYNMNIINIIPTNIYGKHDNFSLKDGHVIPALIHKCYLAKQENKPFVICGSGTPLRQFIYNIDLANCIKHILFHYDQKESIICSPNDEISIGEIGKKIAQLFNYEEHIVFDTSFSDGQFKKTASNKKLLSIYPDIQFTSLDIGLKNSVQWFIENYNQVRK